MTLGSRLSSLALAGALVCLALPASPNLAWAQPVRDGSHDFDFAHGRWHTHATSVKDPFEGGTHTVTLDGTKTSHAMWGGKAWVEEIEADGPDGHWEGMTLFVYNPKAGQWRQVYVDNSGEIDAPTIGSFNGNRGEFYGAETSHGRNVLVRGVWTVVSHDEHLYEISLSQDGGRTWVTGFKADLTRLPDKP
ncbi:MAG TPA: DUF1579 family protein [Caulobacteraceae bacterium]|jgi:hypothetical protein|nr:DUF1579 family protein [Caulobacteraceae bacterium]